MKKHLTTLLLSLTAISITGCGSLTSKEPRQIPEVKVFTEEVKTEIYQPPLPQEVRLEDIRWVVITKNNMEEQVASVEKLLGGEFVVFAMIPSDYENFAWNIQEMRRFIRQQKEIILYYREATGANDNDEKSEWLEKNAKSQKTQEEPVAQTQAEPDSQSLFSKVGELAKAPFTKD